MATDPVDQAKAAGKPLSTLLTGSTLHHAENPSVSPLLLPWSCLSATIRSTIGLGHPTRST
ncbi:hypothetical protein ACLOJK_018197, partial [Asimina triloba]